MTVLRRAVVRRPRPFPISVRNHKGSAGRVVRSCARLMKTPTGAKLWVMEMYVSVFFVPGFIACLSTNAHLVSRQHTVEPFVREKTTVTLLALVRLLLHDLPLCGTLETAGFFTSSTSPSPRTRPDPERRGERRRVGDPTAIVDRRPRIVMVAHYLPRQPRRQGGRVGCKRGRGSSLISTSVCIVCP